MGFQLSGGFDSCIVMSNVITDRKFFIKLNGKRVQRVLNTEQGDGDAKINQKEKGFNPTMFQHREY